jgi:branched-chain amino acid transport system permease protein
MSSLFYIGAFLKNTGLISFFGATVMVLYLAFKDTPKRGIYCLVPPYHLYYALERLRHPWKKQINRFLFGGFWLLIVGVVLAQEASSFTSIGSALLGGIIQGSYFALMAFAIILVFRTTDIVNFAQADLATISVFFLLTLLGEKFGTAGGGMQGEFLIPMGLAILAMLIFSGALGVGVERIFIKPVQRQHPITQIILTIGLSMMLSNLAGIVWDLDEHTLPNILGGAQPNFDLGGGIALAKDGVLSLVVTIVLMIGIFSLFKYTLMGIALRATAQSQTTSKLMGINVNRVFIFSWGISVFLGSLAALFAMSGNTINVFSISSLLLKGFAAAILGGFSSLPGAVLGGFMLGIFDNLLGLLTDLKEALSFLIILLVLIIKPEGILGGRGTKKV